MVSSTHWQYALAQVNIYLLLDYAKVKVQKTWYYRNNSQFQKEAFEMFAMEIAALFLEFVSNCFSKPKI